ncbi:hypothetical protein KBI23_24630 [bacterium]|nr:hypothetical protein [bacterium]MBP9811314.1 hypothetical protein [bacterium]
MPTHLEPSAIVLLVFVAVIALAVAWRAIKNGKVGPQYGLSLKTANMEPKRIAVVLSLSEDQLYGLLNTLIDVVGQDETHLLEPVLSAVGDVVYAHEETLDIFP